MNYYIDFDHTIFDTNQLTKRMLSAIVSTSKMDLMEECTLMFNRQNIYNIYELTKFLSNKYKIIESCFIYNWQYLRKSRKLIKANLKKMYESLFDTC